ncbi:PopZ family protein [Aquibium microcysteis]|uniref:PopZ family protein n=1 Tax=Aquibium microcysteis TaxID=675281 RepID=UPI00165D2552|nr:PopZ family protein [Aquibium microcysteis]
MASHAAELKLPQAGGVQREPSMEEILASIRRIIEDSDQVRKPEDVPARGEPEQARAGAAEEERMDLVAANAPAAAFDLPKAPRPGADEPVARQADQDRAAARPMPGRAEPEARRPQPVDPVVPVSMAADPAAMSEGPAAPEPAMSAPAGETLVQPQPAAHAQPLPQPAAAPVEKASLISERTGRQVAAAFGELTEAFEASRRKTFDELAAEMMRPMLQDWLDNNLPTLVEKLVREEIERVARGGR